MLIKCPECELQVSDKAVNCPHCGYPMAKRPTVRNNPGKHRRLPNGFGQITELKNPNLRNRFRVMVSVGKSEYGRPISKLLKPKAYFETYNEAYKALVEYNKNPYDLDKSMTVQELYDRWSSDFYTKYNAGGVRSYKAAWKYCSSIYDMRAADVRARHIKGCMENGIAVVKGIKKAPSAGVKSRIKSLFNIMLDYAVEYEIVNKNYARTFAVSDDIMKEIDDNKQDHIAFSDEELRILWKNINTVPYTDVVLFQCYSGFRPQELGLLVLTNVNINEEIIVGGMKTPSGTLRKVPIHPKVREIVEKRYKEATEHGSPYLFNCFDDRTYAGKGYKMNYTRYRNRFIGVITALGLDSNHKPHDPRKTFVTKAKEYNMNEYALKRIVGHEIDDITEKIYTERSDSWLIEEMKKIKE